VHPSIRCDFAGVPQQATLCLTCRCSLQVAYALGNEDSIDRLPRATLRGAGPPTQAWLAHIQAKWIGKVFTS
jgi:hypothetical protein